MIVFLMYDEWTFLFEENREFCCQDTQICVSGESTNFKICDGIIDIIAHWKSHLQSFQ